MTELKHPYTSVKYGEELLYGGTQQKSENRTVSKVGCGLIAAADLLLYMSKWHSDFRVPELDGILNDGYVDSGEYEKLSAMLRRHFFPIIPENGINGLMLMGGMERFFRRNRLPYSAKWCASSGRLWSRIMQMLNADIPVIFSVGPNFPFFWESERVAFYARKTNGYFCKISGAKSHYVTVTGIDGEWLRISSWGRLYYINKSEYEAYVRKHSASVFSNILYIMHK